MSNMVTSAPRTSLLGMIYKKTRLRAEMALERELLKKTRCLIDRDPKMLGILHSDVFLLAERRMATFF